jgi:hypothetical protein
MRAHLRTVHLKPYRKGMGPTFTLRMWDTGRTGEYGRSYLAYELRQHDSGGKTTVLFEGDDFSPSPSHAIDGNDSVSGLLGFLTLQPGDTDRDYFERYTDAQMAYAETHAESLNMERIYRFGED